MEFPAKAPCKFLDGRCECKVAFRQSLGYDVFMMAGAIFSFARHGNHEKY